MDVYNDIIHGWWRYIDAILLKALPAPIPYIKNITMDYLEPKEDGSMPVQYMLSTYHYSADPKRDKYLESEVRVFFMNRSNEPPHFVSEITGKASDKNVKLAYGHYDEYEDFEDVLRDNVLPAELKFINQVQKTYPELSIDDLVLSSAPTFTVCKECEESIKTKVTEPAEQLYLDFYGSGELQYYARTIVRRFWETMYTDLGLLDKGAAYDLLTKGISYVIEHYASKHDNEDRAFSPEEYPKVYEYYLAYLFDYLEAMRPIIHRRIVKYNLYMSLDDLFDMKNPKHKKMLADIARLMNPDSGDFQIMFRKPNVDSMNSVEILKDAIDAIDKGKINTFCPWAVHLVRYKL